jgi:hypothetical protein
MSSRTYEHSYGRLIQSVFMMTHHRTPHTTRHPLTAHRIDLLTTCDVIV